MSETHELLFRTMEENWRLARQAEDKRAVIAALNLLVISGLQGILAFSNFDLKMLSLTLWMMSLGVYGIATTTKLYERSQFHILRARKLRARLDTLCPDAQEEDLQQLAEEEHQHHYPLLMRIHLNSIWICLHSLIIVLGLSDTIIIVLR